MMTERTHLLLALMACAAAIGCGALSLVVALRRGAGQDARIALVLGPYLPAGGRADIANPLASRLAIAIGGLLIRRGLLPRRILRDAETLLAGANVRDETPALVIGTKALLLLMLPAVAAALTVFATDIAPLWPAVAAAVLALVLPDMVLGRRRRLRIAAIEHGLPDALDLLSICVDAGLGLGQAMERACREIAPVHPAIAEAFMEAVIRLRLAQDQRIVLSGLGTRFGSEALRRLTASLAQSIEIGVPLSGALKTLAREMRQEQIVRFEAKATRLPVMLSIPLVLFFMPAALLVVAGPAVLDILRNLG